MYSKIRPTTIPIRLPGGVVAGLGGATEASSLMASLAVSTLTSYSGSPTDWSIRVHAVLYSEDAKQNWFVPSRSPGYPLFIRTFCTDGSLPRYAFWAKAPYGGYIWRNALST